MESELEYSPTENGSEKPQITLEEGSRVGDYIITQRLGQGGMCEIFKAIDPALARYVAIKVMLAHLRTPEALLDFLQEARVIAQMRHSNVVPIYSVGDVQGLPWLAMEFIEGPNLEMFLESHGPFNLEEAKDFLRQACSALAYAAKSNVIHLDIKPANFILDPNGTVLLADFGLARRISEVNSGALDGQELMGTPAYASPEHFLQSKPDLRTDIYCLGVSVFNLMTGVLPFDEPDVMNLCRMHLSGDFPVEKLHDLAIPEGWCRFIKKMMEKAPEDRFQNYEEMMVALENIDRFSQGKLDVRTQLGTRHTVPRSGGVAVDLFNMVPKEMVKKGEDLFRFDHPLTADDVRETLEKRWPVLRLNKLVSRLQLLEKPSETDVDDMLWALARIPEYKQTLDSLALFMSADSGHDLKTDEEKLHFIGLDRTRNLAVTARALHEDWQGECLLNHNNFWEYAIYSGFLTGMLADSLDLNITGYEFICALLQDIGKLLLLELYPTKAIFIWIEAYKQGVPTETLEEQYFGLTHYEIAAEWLARHKFNKLICAVTLKQNALDECFDKVKEARTLLRSSIYKKDEVDTLSLVVACGKSLAKELRLGYAGSPFLDPVPWLEQTNTQKLLALKSDEAIGKTEFKKFFTETCASLPEMRLAKLAMADRAVALRKAPKGTEKRPAPSTPTS